MNKRFLPVMMALAACSYAAEGSSPEDILEKALTPPAVTYRARALTTIWRDGKGSTEEIVVYARPTGETRREFLGPDGKIVRVVLSNGKMEHISIPGQKKSLVGRAVKAVPRQMSLERERQLLFENYRLLKCEDERVAGRWGEEVELIPLEKGIPHQLYVVDTRSGIILRARRFLPDTDLGVQTVLLDLETDISLPGDLFQTKPNEPEEPHGLQPDFLTMEETAKENTTALQTPVLLPNGFNLESTDLFEVGKDMVFVARYTDGLADLSLYQTPHPSTFEDHRAQGGAFRSVHWEKGPTYFTLVGDLAESTLNELALYFQTFHAMDVNQSDRQP